MSIFQPLQLQGQTALITGGSSGINLAIAKRYAEHGANIAIVARNPEKLEAARREIAAFGTRVIAVSADVRDFAAMQAAAARTREELGAIDMVIAGAAGNFLAPAAQISGNGFAAVVGIDLLGTFNTLRASHEHLNCPGARLLVISAPQAVNPTPLQAHACAAKAGVESLVKTLAIEWGPQGVRINGISPGAVAGTEGLRVMEGSGFDVSFARYLPIQRYATLDEMADMALALVTTLSAYMTGHIVALDGGTALLGGSFSQAYLAGKAG